MDISSRACSPDRVTLPPTHDLNTGDGPLYSRRSSCPGRCSPADGKACHLGILGLDCTRTAAPAIHDRGADTGSRQFHIVINFGDMFSRNTDLDHLHVVGRFQTRDA